MSADYVSSTCLFVPLRGKKEECGQPSVVAWGFCSKHQRTTQAKNAKEEYETNLQKEYEENLEQLDKELDEIDFDDINDTEHVRIIITPNEYGKFEDKETGILFHSETKTAYGVQGENGEVYDLDEDAIQVCIENGWSFIKPKDKPITEIENEETVEYVDEEEEEDDDNDEVEDD